MVLFGSASMMSGRWSRGVKVGVVLAATLTFSNFLRLKAEEPAKGEAAAKPAAVSYFREVRPIFQANCQGCHQPAKAGGSFVMTSFTPLVKGGESELPAIVAGKSGESNLLAQITPTDGEAAMPQGKKPLSD